MTRGEVEVISGPVDSSTARTGPLAFFSKRYHVLIPCLLIVAFASPLVGFQMPNTTDSLNESYEPIKTLKFVHSKGQAYHKWGPMSAFFYTPIYAGPLLYWKLHGDLGKVSTDFPYGFRQPFEQMGTLIMFARVAGLVLACVCVSFYATALARLTRSKLASCVALVLCVATSPELIRAFVVTKPDGLMLAFLAGSMAAYTRVLADGLTRSRGFWLSVLAVCSISTKELTAVMFAFLYATIAIQGLVSLRSNPVALRRFLVNFASTVAVGVVAYLLLNVVYAPSTWRLRMVEWLWGASKDPAVWAAPDQTVWDYLKAAGQGALFNLGFGAVAVISVTFLIALVAPIKCRLELWLAPIGFTGLVILIAGYMPNYFLSPMNVAVTLPVAVVLGSVGRLWPSLGRQPARGLCGGLIAVCCLVNLWSANFAWIYAYLLPSRVMERYCLDNLDRKILIHDGNFWPKQPGTTRLDYLGFHIDDRALSELADRPEVLPDVVLIGQEQVTWLMQMKDRSSRAAMLESSGVNYRNFQGLEAIGYRLETVLEPKPPAIALMRLPGIRDVYSLGNTPTLVYRKAIP